MKNLLLRYWFKAKTIPGIGVTAYSLEDAIAIVESEDTLMLSEPDFSSYVENIDLCQLDQNHVLPNIGIVDDSGIWFPTICNPPGKQKV